ncbi:MAG: hypothetical protein H6611_09740 [Ignavibacteriales bacterium]|nr:hypothetical protein [Ignavibacteriales bacterium]
MNFEQISVKIKNNDEAKVYLNLPHFKYAKLLGTLYRTSKTFRTIKRSYENLFHLFGFSGLGINTEILQKLNFDFIEIPYNDSLLRTTTEHFIKHSIPSQYQSEKVDKQRILDINKFFVPEEKTKTEDKQAELFEVENV